MEERKNEKKGFWSEHKRLILAGGGVAIAAGVAITVMVIGKQSTVAHSIEGGKIVDAFTEALSNPENLTNVSEVVGEIV